MHKFFAAIAIVCFPFQALAQQTNSYRPGQIYLKTPASSPDQCNAHCQGDAQCKGWNFVIIRHQSAPAICEFNAIHSQPVYHPSSISGEGVSSLSSSKIITAGHRTIRVGQIPTYNPKSSGNTMRVGQQSWQKPPIQKRVVQPVPRTHTPAQATYRQINSSHVERSQRPNAQARISADQTRPQAPVFRHSLDNVSHNTAHIPRAVSTPPTRNDTRQAAHQRPQVAPFKPMLDNQSQPQPQPAPQNLETAPEQKVESQRFSLPSISNMAVRGPVIATDSGLAGAPRRPSLFGSLYDDVKAPRALTKKDIPVDPDAPIPTVTSVPVGQIDQGRL